MSGDPIYSRFAHSSPANPHRYAAAELTASYVCASQWPESILIALPNSARAPGASRAAESAAGEIEIMPVGAGVRDENIGHQLPWKARPGALRNLAACGRRI